MMGVPTLSEIRRAILSLTVAPELASATEKKSIEGLYDRMLVRAVADDASLHTLTGAANVAADVLYEHGYHDLALLLLRETDADRRAAPWHSIEMATELLQRVYDTPCDWIDCHVVAGGAVIHQDGCLWHEVADTCTVLRAVVTDRLDAMPIRLAQAILDGWIRLECSTYSHDGWFRMMVQADKYTDAVWMFGVGWTPPGQRDQRRHSRGIRWGDLPQEIRDDLLPEWAAVDAWDLAGRPAVSAPWFRTLQDVRPSGDRITTDD